MRKTLLWLLPVAVILFSCSNNDNVTAPDWLKTGNRWEYAMSGLVGQDTMVQEITGQNGNEYDVTFTFASGNSYNGIFKLVPDFVEQKNLTQNATTLDFFKRYKLNPQLGDTWSFTAKDGGTVTYKITDLDSTITVPAGTFSCVVYAYQKNGSFPSFIFWNADYGQIKESSLAADIDLISYTIQ